MDGWMSTWMERKNKSRDGVIGVDASLGSAMAMYAT